MFVVMVVMVMLLKMLWTSADDNLGRFVDDQPGDFRVGGRIPTAGHLNHLFHLASGFLF